MDYKKFIRNDIDFKILSNYPFEMAEVEKDFSAFRDNLINYDLGVWIPKKVDTKNPKISEVKIFNSLFLELSWEDVMLNYLKALNSFLREQIGVCVEKKLPRLIDNELTYLIIQRKNYKDYDGNFFIAMDGEVVFPMISKEYDFNLAIIKLAEWKKRANLKNLIKFHH